MTMKEIYEEEKACEKRIRELLDIVMSGYQPYFDYSDELEELKRNAERLAVLNSMSNEIMRNKIHSVLKRMGLKK